MSMKYYRNVYCEYFPCHEGIEEEEFSCMFCYCPLYALKEACGGEFNYTASGIKDCSKCTFPHKKENYDHMVQKTMMMVELTRKQHIEAMRVSGKN